MEKRNKLYVLGFYVTVGFLLTSCAGTPENNPLIMKAKTEYQQAETDTTVVTYAPVALEEAEEALTQAINSLKAGKEEALVNHQAYMAQQRIQIAIETAQLKAAQEAIEQAEAKRQQALIKARKAEAMAAEHRAQMAQQQAKTAQQKALAAQQRAEELAQRIAELEAEKTERGLILTLGDILFAVDKANLKPGGRRAVQELARFMKDYPKRNVLIEGYTDATGSESYNLELSRERANSVRQVLLNNGISGDRIQIRGYGEQYPVATNSTTTGRQQNRRVEIVISDKSGDVVERDQ